MKKIIVPAMALLLIASFAFAEQATTKKHENTSMRANAKMTHPREMMGKIEAVSVADPTKGTKSEITVIGVKSEKMTFLVNPTTTVYDSAFKAIGFDKLKVDEKVMVKYIKTKEGAHEAVSISLKG